MSLLLDSRGLTTKELQRIRLSLSIFQDGTGWETLKTSGSKPHKAITYPGYRQFERVIADVFGGVAPEDKGIFDVLIPISRTGRYAGISCKMKAELNKAEKPNGRVYIELSNAAGGFMDAVIARVGPDFQAHPERTGTALLKVINDWHSTTASYANYDIDLIKSSFLILLYNRQLQLKIYQYALDFLNPTNLTWAFPPPMRNFAQGSRRLTGHASSGDLVMEWYMHSGGQIKYYPLVGQAHWVSQLFDLEPLPKNIESGIMVRAKQYFPDKWK
jgi:hypothetical protein